jgi:hypothetical protein
VTSDPRRFWNPPGARDLGMVGREAVEPGVRLGINGSVYEVVEVRDQDPVDWDEGTRQWHASRGGRDSSGVPAEWPLRPYYVVVHQVTGRGRASKRQHFLIRPYYHRHCWYLMPEHWAVCASCGDPYPCLGKHGEREAQTARAEMERLLAILPGCCWSCGKPITARQRSATFDGENLLMPGGPPPAFHTARSAQHQQVSCLGSAVEYERRWIAQDPERRTRRLSCDGTRFWHQAQGAPSECSEQACPGAEAVHHQSGQCWTNMGAVVPRYQCGAALEQYGLACRGTAAMPVVALDGST